MTDLTTLPVVIPQHSPLGGSAAERFIACPGSAALIQRLGRRKITTEPEWTRHGIAAHEVVAHCLSNYLDVWEVMDRDWNGILFEPDETKSMQDFLDFVRKRIAAVKEEFGSVTICVEFPLVHPEIHDLFYGQLDIGIIAGEHAEIIDYKHGQGIAVDAEMNPQLLYYAAGFIYDNPEVKYCMMWIVQPRAFHPRGPIRNFDIAVPKLLTWLEHTLVPAMETADPRYPPDNPALNLVLNPGEHCRFCPAKLGCPAIKNELVVVEDTGTRDVATASNDELGELLARFPRARMIMKAAEQEGLRRMQDGAEIPGQKLVVKRANRVWKDRVEIEAVFQARFGEGAYSRDLKSPAQMEKMVGAKELVKEYAVTPDAGYTIVPADDKRTAIVLKRLAEEYPNP